MSIHYEAFRHIALSGSYLLLVLGLVALVGLSREKKILLASLRMTLQLVLAGFLLERIFQNPHPLSTIAILLLMETFCAYTVLSQFKTRLFPALRRVIFPAVLLGTIFPILFYTAVILRLSPWYDPVRFIPITGMLIGNSMTGMSLAVQALLDGMGRERRVILERLQLGASPYEASKDVIHTAFDTAMMPTLQSMMGIGIVFLPGMMTGQILAGTSPILAVAYQSGIMFGILAAVTATSILLILGGYRTFFTDSLQFLPSPGERG